MTILTAAPLRAGNAIQLLLRPPPTATSWRVLRRPAPAAPSGPTDPAATVVVRDYTDRTVVDVIGLENDKAYNYRVFYRNRAQEWLPGSYSAIAVPQASYEGDDFDVQTFVRDRIEAGLTVEVARKRIKPSSTGAIDVLLAPFAMADDIAFPCVSVHLESDAVAERAIGEVIMPDSRGDNGWTETEGWLSRVTLNVVGATENPNTRLALRRAIRRIVQANLPIFDAFGMLTVDFQQRDMEDAEGHNVPLFFTVGTFSCLAPSYVSGDVGELDEVTVTLLDAQVEIENG